MSCISYRRRVVDARWAKATGPVPTVDGLVTATNNGAILGRTISSGIDANSPGAQFEVDLGQRHDATGGER